MIKIETVIDILKADLIIPRFHYNKGLPVGRNTQNT